jgi:hypothetical protein
MDGRRVDRSDESVKVIAVRERPTLATSHDHNS